ncbi:hypothetical protein GALMADRAFT_64504 [Galerina marginata CBS 339.88]|uniref:Small nuclear ribonucleoprotein Prp3 C-terminal domain-containing protein n=1 Tax=Galerina marginata (strain CBS 339.88) TaxID=685588 RepID=A0A067TIW1_GALM3|nr:hypothetical protein GALMADRAFT_64504 [Galerina marginata CBS 339.88]
MSGPQLFLALARMHHISNPPKFRRLKRFATQANVSGFVKTGKPGVLVFEGEQASIKRFLGNVRGLRYLDFHHVDTKPMPVSQTRRLAGAKNGLQELKDMSELVNVTECIGEKGWFRVQMGMSKGEGFIQKICVENMHYLPNRTKNSRQCDT